ncbi:type II toxin-antitoxin system PemK/MazF family toxin [Phytoactinopolyspora halophila]|uniref:type II toxin-antitoxin system PemK/MazF family toxin n=1 Tax=Phytoactinopolyspora halophila TaxID=1981511 RepID=UPI001314E3F2|nr:type II toxin-antitoxin system PemK/MazF family toxin [Phytoactinopolyspora halophila]
MKLSQGEIWLAKLSPTVGTEQAGTRPIVVVSGAQFARMPIHQAIVVPVTSRDRNLPHHIKIADDGGLVRDSWAMTEGVRAISTERLVHHISQADDVTVGAILRYIREWFHP